jgi:hypothetical protein
VRNKQNRIYGVRFGYDGETFKASEIGKEFGLRSQFIHYGQTIDGIKSQPKHLEKPAPVQQSEATTSIIGGLLDLPEPAADYDSEEFALLQQQRKKKKRRIIRV